jgi:hypothetical protein
MPASWAPMSSVGAPSANYGYKAIWTGNQMVIWGQGRYDPVLDVWRPRERARMYLSERRLDGK